MEEDKKKNNREDATVKANLETCINGINGEGGNPNTAEKDEDGKKEGIRKVSDLRRKFEVGKDKKKESPEKQNSVKNLIKKFQNTQERPPEDMTTKSKIEGLRKMWEGRHETENERKKVDKNSKQKKEDNSRLGRVNRRLGKGVNTHDSNLLIKGTRSFEMSENLLVLRKKGLGKVEKEEIRCLDPALVETGCDKNKKRISDLNMDKTGSNPLGNDVGSQGIMILEDSRIKEGLGYDWR